MSKIRLVVVSVFLQTMISMNSAFAQSDGEFVGPFKSWLNVKTAFQAKGDGVTDDTEALQKALNAAGEGSNGNIIYLPPGKYVITKTLTLHYRINIGIVGADPAMTQIIWQGATGGTMMELNGTAYSKFDRISFNGNHRASVAIEQSWDGKHPHFDTANEYTDDYFVDVGYGIRGGMLGHGFAETTILRDRFIRNTVAGVSLGNFNALDIWIRDCLFQDCKMGVTNSFGAGNFKVYQSIFLNSTECDIKIGNTGEFAVRGNTSVNSNQFFFAGFTRNPAPTIIEGNTIIKPLNNEAVHIANQGPVIFYRNVIRSRDGTANSVVNITADLLSTGNVFTINNPISSAKNVMISGNQTVPASSLDHFVMPQFPAIAYNYARRIFEVPKDANSEVIQSLIDQAAKLSGTRPVVHLPYGNYNISATLVIPTGSDLQLIGDGFGDQHGSLLTWTGAGTGPCIWLKGPAKATIKDISIKGNGVSSGILITKADQPGSRIMLQEYQQKGGHTGIVADGLSHTLIFANENQLSGLDKAVIVNGGRAAKGKFIIYNGAESDNALSNSISGGGNLTVQDTWYEGSVNTTFADISGKSLFTATGNHIYISAKQAAPFLVTHDFSGKITLAGNDLPGHLNSLNEFSKGLLLIAGNLSEQNLFSDDHFTASSTANIRLNRIRNYGSAAINGGSLLLDDKGNTETIHLDELFKTTEVSLPNLLAPLPKNVTDVRIERVMVLNGSPGLTATAREKSETQEHR